MEECTSIWFRVEVLGLTQRDVISRGVSPIPMARARV